MGYADADGTEPVTRYRCARHCAGCGCWWLSEDADVCPECGEVGEWSCAVRKLDQDAGEKRTGGKFVNTLGEENTKDVYGGGFARVQNQYANQSGGPSRFFVTPDFSHEAAEPPFWHSAAERLALGQTRKYAAKSSRAERDAGLEEFAEQTYNRTNGRGLDNAVRRCPQHNEAIPSGQNCYACGCSIKFDESATSKKKWRNSHPCIKPITLTKWLASLLLPPDIYAPRRLLVPFAGTGSEAIGALLVGWEHVTMIEQSEEYCQTAEARTCFWTGWSAATGETEIKPILEAAKKAQKAQGQTPEPPVPVQSQVEQLTMEAMA